MAATPVAELDFEGIKTNLIAHFSTQAEFADYDFTGSAMNTLMDALAYSTHYAGIYANMNFNEMFLDSAQIRSSVVSKGKEIGYFPKQYTGAETAMTVTIDLSGEAMPPSVVTIAKGTKFAGQYENGESYTFSADATYVLPDIGGNVYSATINIIQGTYTTDTFTYNQNIPTAKFILTNPQIDTNQMTVTVRDFVGSSDINEYTVETNITAATADSLIYFIQEESDGSIRIIFGNGTLGKSLADGNVVKVTYLITEGKNGNQVSSFSVNNTIDGYNGDKIQ